MAFLSTVVAHMWPLWPLDRTACGAPTVSEVAPHGLEKVNVTSINDLDIYVCIEKNLEVGYPTLTNGLSSISSLPEAERYALVFPRHQMIRFLEKFSEVPWSLSMVIVALSPYHH